MLPQHIVKGEGGSIYLDLLSRPTTVTCSGYDKGGGAIFSAAAATVSAANTTLSAAASRGARQLSVAAATGIANGTVLMLKDDPEDVLVYKVDGTTLHLRRPLLKAHVSSAVAQGARCTYAVTSAQASRIFWDGRVNWQVDGVTYWTALECGLYPLRRHAGIQDLFDRSPKLREILDDEVDSERLLDAGFDELLERIGARARARVFAASMEFRVANVLAALMVHYEHQPTDEAAVLFQRYAEALEQKIVRLGQELPRDDNQDGDAAQSDELLNVRGGRLRY